MKATTETAVGNLKAGDRIAGDGGMELVVVGVVHRPASRTVRLTVRPADKAVTTTIRAGIDSTVPVLGNA